MENEPNEEFTSQDCVTKCTRQKANTHTVCFLLGFFQPGSVAEVSLTAYRQEFVFTPEVVGQSGDLNVRNVFPVLILQCTAYFISILLYRIPEVLNQSGTSVH